jgi:hypothetical protein
VNIVASVYTIRSKKPQVVLDAVTTKGIHFGVSVNYMLVQLNMKLSIVDSAQIFHVTSLWDILKEHQIA